MMENFEGCLSFWQIVINTPVQLVVGVKLISYWLEIPVSSVAAECCLSFQNKNKLREDVRPREKHRT